jgi:hypothetical protein
MRGKKLHVSSLSSVSSGKLKVVNPLALPESWFSLIMLHTHKHPPSYLSELRTVIVK